MPKYIKTGFYVCHQRAVAVNFVENDSVYIHGKKLMVTGKEGNQIIRAYTNVRFYKTDISGKCDSIHPSSRTALTKPHRKSGTIERRTKNAQRRFTTTFLSLAPCPVE
jgi:hypothetical protein